MNANNTSKLNESQWAAVTAADGPVLVLAGAGSGKTRVIVERLAWLIGERGVDPRRILALTFTNRAANEMRERVAERLGMSRLGAWMGTFHSFGLYLLRREIEKLGRTSTFTIFDDADQLALMKRLIKGLPSTYAAVSPRDALSWASRYKQDLKRPAEDEMDTPEEETCFALWHRYHDALLQANAVDFDDLLTLPAKLLDEHPDVREKYNDRFHYMHIDEYQDTNRAQYYLARLLSDAHRNLFVVGDEDQSIYAWRGASLRNILDFEHDFPNTQIYRLEQNYRSYIPILDAANALIAHNTERLGKTLWSGHEGGEPVRFFEAHDGTQEAEFVAEQIAARNLEPSETAVLYRTNAQSRLVEEALRQRNMAYQVVGGIQFYQRKEVKDLVAYLRVLANPNDDEALRRVINVPARGIGGTTMREIEEAAAQRNTPLMPALRAMEMDQTLPSRARDKITAFVHLMDELALQAHEASVAQLLEALLERTGYREYVRRTDERDYKDRLEIVDEFVSSCAEYDADGGSGVLRFLQDRALVSDADRLDSEVPGVTLLTCHSAKGLEFGHVFLIGLEEGLLPHASALHSDTEIEEERRLCYVAMTRAQKSLTLCAAATRTVYGETKPREISRFVDEIPDGLIEAITHEGTREAHANRAWPSKTNAKPADHIGQGTGLEQIKMGTRVHHAQFGQGIIMYTKGSGKKQRARIRFDTGRTREFMLHAAPIEVVEKHTK